MGWLGAIIVSIVLRILDILQVLPVVGTNPVVDILVKGMLFGLIIVLVNQFSPI